jgi:hypothetical protein
MRTSEMRKPFPQTPGLPGRLPSGTHYVIEGRRNKSGQLRILSRQVILPTGEHFDVAGPHIAPGCAEPRKRSVQNRRG